MRTIPMLKIVGIALLVTGAATAAAQTLRDPTRPPGRTSKAEAVVAQGRFVLQSILNSPQRKAAVINGKVIGPGESVDGFMLVAVAEDEAVLKKGADVRRLRLYPSVVMKKIRQKEEGAADVAPGATQ
jgi:MSHA biogenesis protein MshK